MRFGDAPKIATSDAPLSRSCLSPDRSVGADTFLQGTGFLIAHYLPWKVQSGAFKSSIFEAF